jgi:hypothetical protein
MPTLEQLNAEAARSKALSQSALGGFGLNLAGLESANLAAGETILSQSTVAPNIAKFDFDRSINITPSASFPKGVGVSGTVTRFGIEPRLAARGSFQQALSGGGGGGTRGTGTGTNVSLTETDIQPQLEAVLSAILASGGTPQAQAASRERASATQALNQTVQDLSAANATALAQGVVDDVIRQTLDELLPQLQAAGEGAGASRSALDALQLNDIAARTAEKAATATIQAITGLTGVQAQAGGVVERLTASDPISQELIGLITGTPRQSTTSQGSVDILNALGLLPEGIDQSTIDQLFAQNAPQFG